MIHRVPSVLALDWLGAAGCACDEDDPSSEGVVYPSGSRNVGDPLSCNTCICEAGALTACTEIAGPEPCPAGTAMAAERECSERSARRLRGQWAMDTLARIPLIMSAALITAAPALTHAQSAEPASDLTRPVEVVVGRDFYFSGGHMPGTLVAIGSSGTIDGAIADLILIGSSARLGPHANVHNRMLSLGSRVERDPGARVTAQHVLIGVPAGSFGHGQDAPRADLGARVIASLFGLLASLALGALCLRFAPEFSTRVTERLRTRPWRAFGSGLLHYLLLVPAALLLVLTIIGIPLLPLYFVIAGALIWSGYVASAAVVGALATPRLRGWKGLLSGLAIAAAVSWVPILGGLFGFLAATFGFGAVMQTVHESRRARRPRPPAAQSPAPLVAPPPAGEAAARA
jgi:hypothetical protein